jgi:UrcA family protein
MSSNLQTSSRAFLAYSSAILLACVLVTSNAAADEQVRTETVKFQDLNVATHAGVEALYSRIHSASKRVCSESDPVMQAAVIACTRNADAKAIEKVNLPLLTAYYRMKNGDHNEAIVAKR